MLVQQPAPKINFEVLSPTYAEARTVSKDDVFGKWDMKTHKKIHNGMIVARHDEKCPIFGDTVPYKSVTVVCEKEHSEDVSYWLEYVQGCDCISEVKELEGNKLAMRSDYMAW